MRSAVMAAPYQPAAGPSRPQLRLAPTYPVQSPLSAPPRTDGMAHHLAQAPASWAGHPGYGAAAPAPSPVARAMPMPSPRPPAPVRRDTSLSEDSAAKRNPFADLIETERVYVEQLTLVIRRVAAAWSRRNLPPPKLDAMFRCVEAVYRANRAFGVRLKEIGANPSDPKALGDLLMRWVDDLEPSYGRYATIYLTGFDNYVPVTNNTLLSDILNEVSANSPPTPPLERWTLDALFLLPYTRLRYYRKLYSRLLRNTTEGRSDHRLLATAAQRLETLVGDVEARLESDVSEEDIPITPASATPSREKSWPNEKAWPNEKERTSLGSSGVDSSVESHTALSSFNSRLDSTRNSTTSAGTSITHSPGLPPKVTIPALSTLPAGPSPPITDLELRIDADRTIDLFTMQPRKCKLHVNPANLPYTRDLRSSHDVTVYFTPTSTGQRVVHRRAHIFILTDLFLITERMEASDKAAKAQQVAREQPNRVGEGGPMPEMWLAYPPLAGKHLAVVEGQQSNVVAVTVMRKETFVIHAESEIERDQIMKSVGDCVDFAMNASQRSTPLLASPVDGPRSPIGAPMRYPSPMSAPHSASGHGHPSPEPSSLAVPMGKLALEQGQAMQWPQAQQPQPQQSTGNALPPRGTSLRSGRPAQPPASSWHAPNQYATPESPGSQLPRNMSQRSTASNHSDQSAMSMHSIPSPHPQFPSRPPTRQQLAPMPPPGGAFAQQQSSGYRQQQSLYPQQPAVQEQPSYPQESPRQPAYPHDHSRHPSYPQDQSRAPAPFPKEQPRRPAYLNDLPPVPQGHPGSHLSEGGQMNYENGAYIPRSRSAEPLHHEADIMRAPDPPSARFGAIRAESPAPGQRAPEPLPKDASPPASPEPEEAVTINGPTTITAQMKCKVFLQQGHAQWKSLGHAKLKLYVEKARNVKQLVVDSDGKAVLISTIVLTDGVERVGRTGVAVEISDRGHRTGIIYMIQLRNESSAGGLYDSLLAGSDRARQ